MIEINRIKNTKYDIFINGMSIILLCGMFLFLILNWNSFPGKLPAHYNFAGEIDRWGNKSELWICPILAVILFVVLTALEFFPQLWNTGVQITDKNQERVYRILKNMLVTLKGVTVGVFSFITVSSALARPMPVWFLPVFLLLLFGSLAVNLLRLANAK
jgi:uncharacterized membrane protein